MTAMLDIDQLRTFIAISETGSFTKAAEVVNKTQSAVSMQMKRLEERLERPIFSRDGRASKLTEDGQRLLDYARRIVKLNVETLAAFSDAELSGRVRLGVPDDYADRYLPEIMARFSHSLSGRRAVGAVRAFSQPARAHRRQRDRSRHRHQLRKQARIGNVPARALAVGDVEPAFDASGRTHPARARTPELFVAAHRHRPNGIGWPPLPRALLKLERRRGRGRRARRAWRCRCCRNPGLRPGMRVLSAADGFPELPSCRVGLVRNAHESSALADALAEHIVSSLDNLSEAAQAAE